MNIELPITKFSSQPMEGVPYTSNLSNYTGYVYGGPTVGTADNFKELHKWDYKYDRTTSTLKIWREDEPENEIVVFDDKPDIYELAFCFNKTMDFVVTYVIREGCYLWSYNPISKSYVDILLEDCTTPKVALSSVHPYHATDSEIVLGYMKPSTNELCVKLERSRFQTEIVVHKFPKKTKLVNISFSDNNRFQYEVLEAL